MLLLLRQPDRGAKPVKQQRKSEGPAGGQCGGGMLTLLHGETPLGDRDANRLQRVHIFLLTAGLRCCCGGMALLLLIGEEFQDVFCHCPDGWLPEEIDEGDFDPGQRLDAVDDSRREQ